MKHCQWCDNSFEPNVKYQIYCSPECREAATKEKIAERYAKNRLTKESHINRKCKSCGTKLSIYNDGNTCTNCEVVPSDVNKILKEMKGIADGKLELTDPDT